MPVAGEIAPRPKQVAAVAAAPAAAASSPAFKNLLIGGDFSTNPWQRGTADFTAIATTPTYTADRWFGLAGAGAAETVHQTTASTLANFPTVLRVQRPNANTNTTAHRIVQIVEGVNVQAAQAQAVVLSFYARSGANFSAASGNINAKVTTGTTTDEGATTFAAGWTGAASPINATQAITAAWVKYTFGGTIAAGANEIAVDIGFTPVGTAGANDWFEIGAVQLEIAATATAFEALPTDVVLARCLRYFWRAVGFSSQISWAGEIDTTSLARFSAVYPVRMRANPTASNTGTIGNFKVRNNGGNQGALSFTYGAFVQDTQSCSVDMTTAAVLSVTSGLFNVASNANTMDFNAEL